MTETPARARAELPARSLESAFLEGVRFVGWFHMGESAVHATLQRLVSRLDEAGIPYAVVGAMALVAYGYRRATVDVDVLLTAEGLSRFKEAWLGHGYVERPPGGRDVRDVETGVPIDFLLAGEYPGDGKPKDVRFPDPSVAGVRGEHVTLLPLERLLELKLASGISSPHRLRDLADVLEVIRATGLDESTAERLAPSVRAKYRDLWRAAQGAGPDDSGAR